MLDGKSLLCSKSSMCHAPYSNQRQLLIIWMLPLLLILAHGKTHGREIEIRDGYFLINDSSTQNDSKPSPSSRRKYRYQQGQSPIVDPLTFKSDSITHRTNAPQCRLRATEQQHSEQYDNFGVDQHERSISNSSTDDDWFPQVLPLGIIYHSYWAGTHEPRLGVQLTSISENGSFWDPTLGARVGLFRYGNADPLHPLGWQLDVEGAAMARLTLDDIRDLETVDFRGGVPLTYGVDNWQFKLGYYHLSSHLGDEYAINNPGSLNNRVNYVRDSIMLGVSHYPVEFLRLYAEVAYAFNATDGAEPWEFQFGTEVSQSGLTGFHGTPFFALNVHLREEHNFGGDFTAEAGWLWRNQIGQVMRIGAFYFNGKSSQYQFYNDSQQQIGVGIWYDF
tara:strand:- start:1232 stop:2404 length:1173 start_codon:yes stop_codon:yes gene_type:complete